jgi:microcystin-dependent protein
MKNSVKIIQNLQTLIILGMLAFFTISMVASDDHTNDNNTSATSDSVWGESGLGEIKMFAGNFAPRDWALCDGQLLSINQHQALFAIIGTIYGGDGRTTFGLPDLRGRVAIHQGTGPGLRSIRLGERGGVETNTLSLSQLPAHTHSAQIEGKAYMASGDGVNSNEPGGNYLGSTEENIYTDQGTTKMAPLDITDLSIKMNAAGQSQPVNNMQPYVAVNYIICLDGTFPSRN